MNESRMRRVRKRLWSGRWARRGGVREVLNGDGERSLRVWILILAGARGKAALVSSLSSVGENNRRRALARQLNGHQTGAACAPCCAQTCALEFTVSLLDSMWGLDRLSAYSTPSGTPPPRRDSYSPAPRRGYPPLGPGPLPPRPGLNPRSSSLSLVSPNSSSTSLANAGRPPNGAPRRRPTGAYTNSPDPLHVLESIMGGPSRKPIIANGGAKDAIPQKPHAVDSDIDFGELSLHDFVVEEAPEPRQYKPVHTYSAQSVEECTWSYVIAHPSYLF